MAETPFDNTKQLDEEHEKCVERMIANAIRQGKQLPDFGACQRMLYKYAKQKHGYSNKGAKAWASLKVEHYRRIVAKVLDAEEIGK
jgi:hypothetical protein